jgi:hypothetical protein
MLRSMLPRVGTETIARHCPWSILPRERLMKAAATATADASATDVDVDHDTAYIERTIHLSGGGSKPTSSQGDRPDSGS